MGREPLRLHGSYTLKLTTEEVGCTVAAIEHVLDANTLVPVAGDEVGRYQVAQVVLQTRAPLALDAQSELAAT
jgi:bifunctional enzyme CysN/CysC